MNVSLCFPCALLLALAAPTHACDVRAELALPALNVPVEAPLDAVARDAILAVHNRCRRSAVPRPDPPLGPLRWDDTAARVAQRWARQCEFAHNDARGPYGENIAFATQGTLGVLLGLWTGEAPQFRYATNRCSAGMCGHYTQVVSRRTTSVGCAVARCSFGLYLVCDYAPPGNVVGRKPY